MLAVETQLELLFEFPYPGTNGEWFPSWGQLLEWPDRDPTLQHLTRQVKLHVSHKKFVNCTHLINSQYKGHYVLWVENVWILPNVTLQHTEVAAAEDNDDFAFSHNEYIIQTTNVAGNACGRSRIVTQRSIPFRGVYFDGANKRVPGGLYFLITPRPKTSHNWVVCEQVWDLMASSITTPLCPAHGCIRDLHGKIFRKIGILRTDFVVSLTGPDSTLEIGSQCMFI